MPIPLSARDPLQFPPPSLRETKPNVKILVRVPTPYERDTYESTLVRSGLVDYTRRQIRDLTIAGIDAMFPKGEFEEKSALLEEFWRFGDAMQELRVEKLQVNIERIQQNEALPLSERMDEPALIAKIQEELDAMQPDMIMGEERIKRAQAIVQQLTSDFDPLRRCAVDMYEQDVKRTWFNIELYVKDWEGIIIDGEPVHPTGNGRGGITREEAEFLRRQIGVDAFNEVGGFITSMHTLTDDDEKNLQSLLASASAPIGSTQPESKASNDAGSSEDTPSGSTPGAESPPTTKRSSRRSATSRTKTARSGASPTKPDTSISP